VVSDSDLSDQRAIVTEHPENVDDAELRRQEIDARMTKIAKMLTLSVVYAANIGGTATLTGTATNLIINDNVNRSAAFSALF